MNIVRLKFKSSAFRKVLRSAEAVALTAEHGKRIARQADAASGAKHEVKSSVGANRARTAVMAVSYRARRAEAKHKTLTKSLRRG